MGQYDKLTSLIPRFERPAEELAPYIKCNIDDQGVIHIGYWDYDSVVDDFWEILYATWDTPRYREVLNEQHINPRRALARDSYDSLDATAVLALLTWLTRAERFGDGVIAGAISSGKLLRLLKRLEAIDDEQSS